MGALHWTSVSLFITLVPNAHQGPPLDTLIVLPATQGVRPHTLGNPPGPGWMGTQHTVPSFFILHSLSSLLGLDFIQLMAAVI